MDAAFGEKLRSGRHHAAWLIAAGGFTHVVAGSNEIFNLVLIGEMNILTAFVNHIFPILIGNTVGGTGLFAMLAYG
ncbi:MAG: hypothetical protein ACOH2B_14805 [Burkholderiaceae bacterium]